MSLWFLTCICLEANDTDHLFVGDGYSRLGDWAFCLGELEAGVSMPHWALRLKRQRSFNGRRQFFSLISEAGILPRSFCQTATLNQPPYPVGFFSSAYSLSRFDQLCLNLANFLTWAVLILLSFESSFYILTVNLLSDVPSANIFSQNSLYFHLFDTGFHRASF